MAGMNELIVNEGGCEPKACEVSTTLNDRLTAKKRKLETELSETNAALEALAANPEVARVLTLVCRAIGSRW